MVLPMYHGPDRLRAEPCRRELVSQFGDCSQSCVDLHLFEHNKFSCDPGLGRCSAWQCMAPYLSYTVELRSNMTPKTALGRQLAGGVHIPLTSIC